VNADRAGRRSVTRYVALLRDPAPLGGICPACGDVMDESGCRIGDHARGTSPSGIRQVVEVFCTGTPMMPVTECPACR
jgi:hypothetical protein